MLPGTDRTTSTSSPIHPTLHHSHEHLASSNTDATVPADPDHTAAYMPGRFSVAHSGGQRRCVWRRACHWRRTDPPRLTPLASPRHGGRTGCVFHMLRSFAVIKRRQQETHPAATPHNPQQRASSLDHYDDPLPLGLCRITGPGGGRNLASSLPQ